MINKLKQIKAIRKLHDKFRSWSIRIAVKKYRGWFKLLDIWSIDITEQYTNLKMNSDYLKLNVRAMHAFQLKLIDQSILYFLLTEDVKKEIKILDFGDSSGAHCQYIKKLYPYYNIKTLSVNVDYEAVKKIKKKGLPAMQVMEEEDLNCCLLQKRDMIMSFEVFEHLENPIKTLRDMAIISNKLILTVPYVKRSRVGIQDFKDINKENTHLFELCPEDWKKLFRYTGWEVKYEEIYYQYPRRIPLLSWLLKIYWMRFDYGGFYGVILKKEGAL